MLDITNIASVSINNYKISDYINNLRLGIGEDYSFDVICNDTATYGTKMTVKLYSSYVINVTYDSIEKTIMIPNDKRLFGAILELSFETLDGNDYRMYQFEIVSPYTVDAEIVNDQVKVTFKDVFEKIISSDDIYSDITYYYYLNGNRYSIEGTGTQCDLISVPHFEQSILINVIVDYKNSQLDNYTTELSYSVNNVYGLSQTLSSSGVNKWVINAQNDKTTVSNTLTVPSKIKAVNILGKAGTTYSDYKISVQSRTVPLTINLNNFNFSASNSYAIYASGTCEVIINVYGLCTIATTAEGYDCIRVYNLTISKGTLKVKGSNRKTTSATVSAGKGINVDNLLTVDNCNLTVTGGNGVVSSSTRNGYAGVNGGTAVSAKSLLVKSSTLTFTGGNGSNGHNGSAGGAGSSGSTSSVSGKPGSNGGNGGKGGNGGLALNINTLQTWSNSRATLIGGTGGNGGNGGAGGNGGNGYNSGNGGAGGTGGNGGMEGIAGKACNISMSYSNVTIKDGTAGRRGNGGNGGTGGAGGSKSSTGGIGGVAVLVVAVISAATAATAAMAATAVIAMTLGEVAAEVAVGLAAMAIIKEVTEVKVATVVLVQMVETVVMVEMALLLVEKAAMAVTVEMDIMIPVSLAVVIMVAMVEMVEKEVIVKQQVFMQIRAMAAMAVTAAILEVMGKDLMEVKEVMDI